MFGITNGLYLPEFMRVLFAEPHGTKNAASSAQAKRREAEGIAKAAADRSSAVSNFIVAHAHAASDEHEPAPHAPLVAKDVASEASSVHDFGHRCVCVSAARVL